MAAKAEYVPDNRMECAKKRQQNHRFAKRTSRLRLIERYKIRDEI